MWINGNATRVHQTAFDQNWSHCRVVQAGHFNRVLSWIRPVNSSRDPVDSDALGWDDVCIDECSLVGSIILRVENGFRRNVTPVNATFSAIFIDSNSPKKYLRNYYQSFYIPIKATHMLAVETGVPRLFPLNEIFTAATPCETIKKPVSSFGGSLQTEPLPVKPEIRKKENQF